MATTFNQLPEAILYGARARGTNKPYSDIGLTLIAPEISSASLHEIEKQIDDLLLPNRVDLTLYHKISDASLVEQINSSGKLLYKRAELK